MRSFKVGERMAKFLKEDKGIASREYAMVMLELTKKLADKISARRSYYTTLIEEETRGKQDGGRDASRRQHSIATHLDHNIRSMLLIISCFLCCLEALGLGGKKDGVTYSVDEASFGDTQLDALFAGSYEDATETVKALLAFLFDRIGRGVLAKQTLGYYLDTIGDIKDTKSLFEQITISDEAFVLTMFRYNKKALTTAAVNQGGEGTTGGGSAEKKRGRKASKPSFLDNIGSYYAFYESVFHRRENVTDEGSDSPYCVWYDAVIKELNKGRRERQKLEQKCRTRELLGSDRSMREARKEVTNQLGKKSVFDRAHELENIDAIMETDDEEDTLLVAV